MEMVQTISHHRHESDKCLSDALASRGMRLLEVTAALAKAQTEHEVSDVVLGKGLAAAGATRGFLARVDADRVEIVRASGYAPEVEARLVGPAAELPALRRSTSSDTGGCMRASASRPCRTHPSRSRCRW